MNFLKVGQITKTYGLQGEVKVYSTTDFPEKRFKKGNELYLYNPKDETRTKIVIRHYRPLASSLVAVAFKGYDNINQVESLLGMELHVEKDAKFLPKDTYFNEDLEKCNVYQEDGVQLGFVKKVENYNGKISLRIKTNEKEILVPFNEFFVINVNIETNKIVVRLIEGML